MLLGFLALTLPLMPVQFLLNHSFLKAARLLPYAYHRCVCYLLGINIILAGQLPRIPVLLVSNHVSWLDIPVLSAILPLSFIAKREVGTWPFFSALAKLQRTVFIDRERRLQTGTSSHEIGERLVLGDTLVLFPEGTSNNGREVRQFKSAFFGAVENVNVPVVPVTLAYTAIRNLPLTPRERPFTAWYGNMDLLPHLWQALKSGPLQVTVHFHEALTRTDRKSMARTAEAKITRGLLDALHGHREIS